MESELKLNASGPLVHSIKNVFSILGRIFSLRPPEGIEFDSDFSKISSIKSSSVSFLIEVLKHVVVSHEAKKLNSTKKYIICFIIHYITKGNQKYAINRFLTSLIFATSGFS